jgi:hypothetical protein
MSLNNHWERGGWDVCLLHHREAPMHIYCSYKTLRCTLHAPNSSSDNEWLHKKEPIFFPPTSAFSPQQRTCNKHWGRVWKDKIRGHHDSAYVYRWTMPRGWHLIRGGGNKPKWPWNASECSSHYAKRRMRKTREPNAKRDIHCVRRHELWGTTFSAKGDPQKFLRLPSLQVQLRWYIYPDKRARTQVLCFFSSWSFLWLAHLQDYIYCRAKRVFCLSF